PHAEAPARSNIRAPRCPGTLSGAPLRLTTPTRTRTPPPSAPPDTATNTPMTHTLQLDGRRAAFDESGPAAAPAILLIHGAGHDRGVWQAVAAGLAAAGRRVIVPDLPGHGDS